MIGGKHEASGVVESQPQLDHDLAWAVARRAKETAASWTVDITPYGLLSVSQRGSHEEVWAAFRTAAAMGIDIGLPATLPNLGPWVGVEGDSVTRLRLELGSGAGVTAWFTAADAGITVYGPARLANTWPWRALRDAAEAFRKAAAGRSDERRSHEC